MTLGSARAVRSPSAIRRDTRDSASSGSLSGRACRRATRTATSKAVTARALIASQARMTRVQTTVTAAEARTTPTTSSPDVIGTATTRSVPICPSATAPLAALLVIGSAVPGPFPALRRIFRS